MMTIYPSGMTNQERLFALYPLIEQSRLWHNQEGARVRSSPELRPNWNGYANRPNLWHESPYWKLVLPLYRERNELRRQIRKAEFPNNEDWKALSDGERLEAFDTMFGRRDKLVKGLQLKDKLPVSSTLFNQLKAIDLAELEGILPPDPLEDWTTYTEEDTGNYLTVLANTITCADMPRNAVTFVYDDKDAGHFGTTFSSPHLLSTDCSESVDESEGYYWSISNTTEPQRYVEGIINIRWIYLTPQAHILIDDGATEEEDNSYSVLKDGTRYWMTINRANPTTCAVYDASQRDPGDLVDTVSVAQGTTSFRYIHSIHPMGGSGAGETSFHVYDLDLQEVAPEGWTGKIMGVTNPAKIMGVSVANISKVLGVS